MRETRPINVTGTREWKYIPAVKTDVGATMRAWLRAYEQAWDEAHAENATTSREVVAIKRRAAK